MRKKRYFTDYPIRTCRTYHTCAVCCESIYIGESYHDGGYGRRVHVKCVSTSDKEKAAIACSGNSEQTKVLQSPPFAASNKESENAPDGN